MRILLVSTYELGHQPLGLAAPAGALRAAGHEARGRDTSLGGLEAADLAWAEAVAFSVPMHTALRLALPLVEQVRTSWPALPIALHGLYAPVAAGHRLLDGRDLLAAGDGAALVAWADELAGSGPPAAIAGGPRLAVGPPAAGRRAAPPDRAGLAPLSSYARLLAGGGARLTGAVEASQGCNHRCRHCPVPVVYGGRSRAVDPDDVLADAGSLVAAGAEHLSFADPDFLNRPRHAAEVVRRLHAAFPALTFDVTVKVEHVLRHEGLWPSLAAAGCLFVVSAFESIDDRVLALLDKGHTRADEVRAIGILRGAGIEPRPSLLPFHPWTALGDLAELLEFVVEHDLVPNVDPVQYGIRLLLPPGSLLLVDPDPQLAASLGDYDDDALSWTWHAADPRVEALQAEVAAIAEAADARGDAPETAFAAIEAAARTAAGLPPAAAAAARRDGTERPRLSEAWFCCAEPTARQLATVHPR